MIKKTPHFLGFGEFFSFFRVASNNATLNSKELLMQPYGVTFEKPNIYSTHHY